MSPSAASSSRCVSRHRSITPWNAIAAAPVHAADDHKPQHGGVVVETKTGDMELVAKPDLIVIHVSDHGKPTKLTSATGKVTVFNGSVKTEAPLTLAGDKLEAKGSFKLGEIGRASCRERV